MATAMTPAEDNHDWSLESLNKAYQQGYMAGLTGQPQHAQPHPVEVLAAAWEAGWDEVQRANMAKVRAAEDGSDSKRGSSWDVVKPDGWRDPDLEAVLQRMGWTAK